MDAFDGIGLSWTRHSRSSDGRQAHIGKDRNGFSPFRDLTWLLHLARAVPPPSAEAINDWVLPEARPTLPTIKRASEPVRGRGTS